MRRILAVAVLAGVLAGCATTNEMPLAHNAVRLDTHASGLAFTSSAGSITMTRAADATLKRGYTHFRLEQPSMSSGRRLAGMTTHSWGSGRATAYGNTAYGTMSGTSFTMPTYAPTANIGVTVVMFRANEPGARGAFDAAEVIRKGGRV